MPSTSSAVKPGKRGKKSRKAVLSPRKSAAKKPSKKVAHKNGHASADEALPYRFGPSPIDGFGVFATRAIAKGEYIGDYEGPPAKRNGKYVLWIYDDKRVYGARSGRNGLRYLNHSRKPNAEFDGFSLYAIKRIRTGDEITFNYGDPELEFY